MAVEVDRRLVGHVLSLLWKSRRGLVRKRPIGLGLCAQTGNKGVRIACKKGNARNGIVGREARFSMSPFRLLFQGAREAAARRRAAAL